MRKSHKYCKHNKVVKSYADGGKVEGKKRGKKEKAPKPDPDMLGDGAAGRAADALKNRRKQQLRDLGID